MFRFLLLLLFLTLLSCKDKVDLTKNNSTVNPVPLSCSNGYFLNNSNVCEVINNSCTLADVQLNGWDTNHSETISGHISVEENTCSISSCDRFSTLDTSNKKCVSHKKHVFLLIGQSNAVGTTTSVDCLTRDAPNSRIFQWSRGYQGIANGNTCDYTPSVTNDWIIAREPLQHYSMINYSHGFILKFAKNYLNTIEPNETINIIAAAKGGTSFKAGEWTPTGALYLDAVNKTNEVLLDPTTELKGIFWQQGEGDTGQTYSQNYQNHVLTMLSSLKNNISYYDENKVKFITGTMSPDFTTDNSPYSGIINGFLSKINQYQKNSACINTSDLTTVDRIHFDSNSLYVMGDRYFDAFNNATNSIYNPPITSITFTQNSIYNTSPASSVVGTMSSVGGTPPYSYSIVSQDGNNLSVNGSNLVVANQLSSGTYNITVESTDYWGNKYQKSLSINVAIQNHFSVAGNGTTATKFVFGGLVGSNIIDLNQSFTISTYLKLTQGSLNHSIISTRDPLDNHRGIQFYVKSNGHVMVLLYDNFNTSSILTYETLNSFPLNTWTHLAFTLNSSGLIGKIYFDGIEQNNVKTSTLLAGYNFNSNQALTLGARTVDYGIALKGLFTDLSFWDATLSLSEIQEVISKKYQLRTHSKVANLKRYFEVDQSGSGFSETIGTANPTITGMSISTDSP